MKVDVKIFTPAPHGVDPELEKYLFSINEPDTPSGSSITLEVSPAEFSTAKEMSEKEEWKFYCTNRKEPAFAEGAWS